MPDGFLYPDMRIHESGQPIFCWRTDFQTHYKFSFLKSLGVCPVAFLKAL